MITDSPSRFGLTGNRAGDILEDWTPFDRDEVRDETTVDGVLLVAGTVERPTWVLLEDSDGGWRLPVVFHSMGVQEVRGFLARELGDDAWRQFRVAGLARIRPDDAPDSIVLAVATFWLPDDHPVLDLPELSLVQVGAASMSDAVDRYLLERLGRLGNGRTLNTQSDRS